MPALTAPLLDEARENLRVIRQVMERSTKYSTLSGLSGVLVGLTAIAGVAATRHVRRHLRPPAALAADLAGRPGRWPSPWTSPATSAGRPRSASASSRPWARTSWWPPCRPSSPGPLLTVFFALHHLLFYVWGAWMLCYGLAICAVGLFSVRPVSYLGMAFVLAGALTLFLRPPVSSGHDGGDLRRLPHRLRPLDRAEGRMVVQDGYAEMIESVKSLDEIIHPEGPAGHHVRA